MTASSSGYAKSQSSPPKVGSIAKVGGEHALVVGEDEDGNLLVAVLTGRVTAVTVDQLDKEEGEK